MHPRKPAVSFIDPETEEELTLSSGCWVQRASISYAVYVLCTMKVLHICASLSHLLLGILSAIQQKKEVIMEGEKGASASSNSLVYLQCQELKPQG